VEDDDVEVKIEYCGICGSDLHTAFGGWGEVEYPIIVGHEIVGKVTKKGKNVKHLEIGDRVGCGAQCGSCLQRDPAKCRGCGTGNENHCAVHNIGTYNGKYDDGERSQGGYADYKRFNANFAFKIPDALPSAEAAPLLCAGATVYSPLKRYGAGPGKKVGVIGIGGLGHLAVMFAAKMGADSVVAIGRSKGKAEEAKKLGATEYISIEDEEAYKKHKHSLDIIICCANGNGMDYDKYLMLGALDAYFVLVALPEEELKVKPFTLMGSRVHMVGSSIGNLSEIKEMLQFAADHDVKPVIELLPMSQVNEGIRKVKENDVKFRVVLQQGK
jgi:alcohol dehydrogenase (NADP+)